MAASCQEFSESPILTGAARLQFEDRVVDLLLGDSINIPAHQKHRVEWTSPDEPTVWLAVFYRGGLAGAAERDLRSR